jgi:hypothetical protein
LVHRALDIGAVLGQAVRQGHPLGFVTLTMRHREGQALELLWNAARSGWKRAVSGRGWVAVEELVEGWVRVWEVSHGQNGWHVHVHCVCVLAKDAGAQDLELVAGGLFERWSAGLVAAGLDAPLVKGQDWHLATGEDAAEQLADYLAKSVAVVDQAHNVATGLGLELTHNRPGRTRGGLATRPVWSLLREARETGEIGRWREWERVSKGKRQVGWSNGLRERFAPEVEEVTDQAIVDEEHGTWRDDVVGWSVDEWRVFIRQGALAVDLVEWVRVEGVAGARRFFAMHPEALGTVLDHQPSDLGGSGGRTVADGRASGRSTGPTDAGATDRRLQTDHRPSLRGAGGATPRGAMPNRQPGSPDVGGSPGQAPFRHRP